MKLKIDLPDGTDVVVDIKAQYGPPRIDHVIMTPWGEPEVMQGLPQHSTNLDNLKGVKGTPTGARHLAYVLVRGGHNIDIRTDELEWIATQ
jgi:hypothetical protein